MNEARWKHLDRPDLDIVNDLSVMIRDAEMAGVITLPDLRVVNRLIVASDYRTPDRRCDFHVISYLIMGAHNIRSWEPQRLLWRRQYLGDGRRLAFKDLGSDELQRRAVEPFLEIANDIDGVIATVAFHKSILSMFNEGGRLKMTAPDLARWSHWKSAPFENMLRVIHFESFFLGGLSRDQQEVICISDRDEILASAQRLQEFCDISNMITPEYVQHSLKLQTATTEQDDGSLFAEDLAAIPDLVAGALGDVLTVQSRRGVLANSPVITFVPSEVQEKSQRILAWYIQTDRPLRRLLCRFTKGSKPNTIVSAVCQYKDGIEALTV